MSQQELIFCNASLRPNCLLNTNLCCLVCNQRDECYLQCGRIKPCTSDDYDDDKCEYLV